MKDFKWLILPGLILVVAITVGILLSREPELTTRFEDVSDIDNGDLNINWNKYQVTDVELSSSVEFTKPGVYHLTGNLYEGLVSIKIDPETPIKLILDNVVIENDDGPAIACYSGDDLVIELVGNNILSDGVVYGSQYDEDITSVIYSKADLSFVGDGSLNLVGNYQDGIVSKDDLTFRSGVYSISAQDDGIRGKDSVHIVGGNFSIDAVSDAIKSTNDTDYGKGFVLIEGGSFNLNAGAKGIKAINSVIIENGYYAAKAQDDTLHSDNFIGINGGVINLYSGDDAIHANKQLEINGGEISIAQSNEGLEAQKITINDGKISVVASDDGINAGSLDADASTSTRVNNRFFDADESCIISVNGGEVHVNSSGDGIDSNGWIYFNGGKTIVDGPVNDGNGALDAGMGIVMNGGEVIAVGSSGMAETLGQTSAVNNVSIYLSQVYPEGTEISIKDVSDNEILSHLASKSFSHLAVGSESFQLGGTYTLYLNGELNMKFTISDVSTIVGRINSRAKGGH